MPRRAALLAGTALLAASLAAGGLTSGAAIAAPWHSGASAGAADLGAAGAAGTSAPVAFAGGAVATAGASTPRSRSDARPRVADIIARSTPLDVRADDPTITFIGGLPRDRTALDVAATKASNPKELSFRDFMTLAQAGSAYGASSKTIKKVRAAVKKAGVEVRIDSSRLLGRFTATASVWQELYGSRVRVSQASAASPYRVYIVPVSGGAPAGAPKALKDVTVEWMAMYSEYVASADTPGIDPAAKASLSDLLASTGTPQAWPSNTGTLPTDTCGQQALTKREVLAPSQIRKAYGSGALATRGMKGAGTRLTILSLGGGFDLADIQAAATCFGYRQPAITTDLALGVTEPFVSATTEGHLDLITASSVLPDAESIRWLEAVDTANTVTDAFAKSLDMDGKGATSPDVVSISYGICESQYVEDFAAVMPLNEDILRMGALVGTGFVVAAGDYGSSMCGADASLENGPQVWYPASSPWVTAVGGTRLALTTANTRAQETVWNDAPFTGGTRPGAVSPAGAGGPSAVFARPWYQGGVTPTGPRAVPDVALLGAERPGWPIYYGGALYTVGGTSGAAPFLAANLALMAADQRAKGYPGLGFVNPWFYQAAAATKSPFYDVTTGSNAVQMVGCCSAYPGYDMASGLGVPDMSALYRTVPYPAG